MLNAVKPIIFEINVTKTLAWQVPVIQEENAALIGKHNFISNNYDCCYRSAKLLLVYTTVAAENTGRS